MKGLLGDYHKLLSSFLDAGYEYSFFNNNIDQIGKIILRHDIDFSLENANRISFVEDSLGIKSTYFILLRSDFYNILSKSNFEIIRSLQKRGHKIGIHFDSSLYLDTNLVDGLNFEIDFFDHLFNEPVEIIAPHRPDKIFLENTISLGDISHTYEKKFFKDIKYISDSTGRFRFDKPHEFILSGENQSLQLNLHPIWWSTTSGSSPIEIVEHFLQVSNENLEKSMEQNFTDYSKTK